MICVTYWPGRNRISLRGHAESGPYGNDAVCAAASVLAYSLAEALQQHARESRCPPPQVRLLPGDARISCRRGDPIADALFRAFAQGYLLLASACPGQVWVRIK